MDNSQALSGLTPETDFAFVYGFHQPHAAFGMVETVPAKREQLAWTERVRHIEFQQNAVSQLQL